jgi:hypothetical protein
MRCRRLNEAIDLSGPGSASALPGARTRKIDNE